MDAVGWAAMVEDLQAPYEDVAALAMHAEGVTPSGSKPAVPDDYSLDVLEANAGAVIFAHSEVAAVKEHVLKPELSAAGVARVVSAGASAVPKLDAVGIYPHVMVIRCLEGAFFENKIRRDPLGVGWRLELDRAERAALNMDALDPTSDPQRADANLRSEPHREVARTADVLVP